MRLLNQFLSPKFLTVLAGEPETIELDPDDPNLMIDLELLDLIVGYLTSQCSSLQLQEINSQVLMYMTPASPREPVHL